MNLVPRPGGHDDRNEPFVPDFSEGAETGLYLALLELLDEGLVITGDETILEVNSAACRLLERDYRQLAGKPLADIFASERAFLEARARLFIQGEMRGSLQIALPDGRHRNLRFVAAARIRPGVHALILSPDLIAEAYADTPPTDTLWPRLAAALEQPVIVVDDAGQVAAANAAALQTLGVARARLVGQPLESCLQVSWPEGGAPVARLQVPGSAEAMNARVLPGPRPDWRLLILPPAGAKTTGPARDEAPREPAAAHHDALTGLPDFDLFSMRFAEAIARAQAVRRSVGVLRIDIDDFKSVNRRHGRTAGDAVLQQVARRLLAALPRGATVARKRSDTFLVLLPEVDLANELERAAERALATLAEPFHTAGEPLQLTASIGLTRCPEDGATLDVLLRHADAAVEHARHLGGNRIQGYADELEAVGADRLAFQADLRHAVERGQLEVHFQPLIDARDHRVRGGEALLRWRHPELGLVPFRRFMGVAREAGLLATLGDWALRAACAEAAKWPAEGDAAPLLTVNVAIEQIVQDGFATRVADALSASGLPAGRLELDLDEVVLQKDAPRIDAALAAVTALGVRLAIDDFGHGLASIPKLKRYPLRALKLDPALVREVGTHEDSEAIVEAIATMAGVLGLQVLARGVESAAQQAFLGALGCHLQQGPLFGRPMAAGEFLGYLKSAPEL